MLMKHTNFPKPVAPFTSFPVMTALIASTCSLPGEKARPYCSKANATASNKTFVESRLARNARHIIQKSRYKPNLEVLPNMVFPPNLGGKNGGVLSMRMQVILGCLPETIRLENSLSMVMNFPPG